MNPKQLTIQNRMRDIAKYNRLTPELLELLKKGEIRKIYLSGGNDHLFILVDADDYEFLNKHRWYMTFNDGEPIIKGRLRNTPYRGSRQSPLVIGRLIMNVIGKRTTKGFRVRYKNGDVFNNLKSNLELW